MELVAVDDEGTLFVSGVIDHWAAVRSHQIDTIVDMDGDVDPGVPEAPNAILYEVFAEHVRKLPARRIRVELA